MGSQSLTDMAIRFGAAAAAVTEVDKIAFYREFREACEQNTCGKYGRCWMCPPDVGQIDEMIARAKTYRHAFVYQSVGMLEDSFDIDGMEEAARRHNRIAQSLAESVVPSPLRDPLHLAAGACHVCERCTRLDNLPCCHPDNALASLESYGIAVSQLAETCGMKYINGANTVTYFGAFLYND